MYHYIEDKEFLGKMKSCCSDIMNQLKQQINNNSVMKVEIRLIGSGAKNLITQNANQPIDLDYNLCILKYDQTRTPRERDIKNYITEQLNCVLNKNGWGSCKDSTSAISTEQRCFTRGNPTPFSIDLAIIIKDSHGSHRLIHEKTGYTLLDRYYWNLAPGSEGLAEKIEAIKKYGLWSDVRELYLKKKNLYLKRNDHNHASFVVYIETINEIYHKNF